MLMSFAKPRSSLQDAWQNYIAGVLTVTSRVADRNLDRWSDRLKISGPIGNPSNIHGKKIKIL